MERPPLVFLHAFPLDARMWEATRDGVGTWPSVAPDFPGFGGTAPGTHSLEAYADEVLARLDAAGVGRFVPVGLSMGGYVAFRLLARAPGRVAGLVLCDTRATADDETAAARRTAQAARARDEGTAWLADAMVPGLLSAATRRDRPDVEASVRATISRASPEGVARALEALRDRPDSTPLLAGVRVPALAIVGADDGLTTPAEMAAMAAAIPGARLEVLPGAGHLSCLEAPAAFDAALGGFLRTRIAP